MISEPVTDAWVCVTPQSNIPLREGRAIQLGGHEIAIFNLGDRVLAVANRCPHRGGPLSDGLLADGVVVCPLHAWKIALASGNVERPAGREACVATYAARLENGLIYVALPRPQAAA